MNKIELYRTHILINDYNLGDCTRIENCFRVYEPITHSYKYIGMEYDEENKQLYLPRGIDVMFIENCIGENAVNIDNYYPFQKFNGVQIKYMPRDNVQLTALKFMCGQEKYQRNKYLSQLGVNLNTGKGKTYASIASVAFLGIKTIIITYSTRLLDQWSKCIQEYTNVKQEEICMLTGSSKINRTLKEGGDRYKFLLVSHSTLASYAKANGGYDSIGDLFRELKIGIKIYDEAHICTNSMYSIDFHTDVFKTYYVTATPARSNEQENHILKFAFKNIPSIDLFDEESDPHTHVIAIKYNSHPDIRILNDCKNKYGLDRNKYTNYVVTSPWFYKLLTLLLNRIIHFGGKTLIYIGTIEAMDIVYDWIIKNFPEFRYNTCVLNSTVSDKEIANRNQIILSTTKSAGTGVDIRGLKRTIVLAEPFKSEVLCRQTLGRTRDYDTEYIEVVDRGFYNIPKWFNSKKPIYQKYGLTCKTMNLTDRRLDELYNDIMKQRIQWSWSTYNKPKVSPLIYERKCLRYY